MKEIIEAMEKAVMLIEGGYMNSEAKAVSWGLRKAIARAKELQEVESKPVFGK